MMQDNNKDILANKGWDAMQLILDEEMPQKKKRRFLIWWVFGGLLLLSAFLIFQISDIRQKGNKLIVDSAIPKTQIIRNTDSTQELETTKEAEVEIVKGSNQKLNSTSEDLQSSSTAKSTPVNSAPAKSTQEKKFDIIEPVKKILNAPITKPTAKTDNSKLASPRPRIIEDAYQQTLPKETFAAARNENVETENPEEIKNVELVTDITDDKSSSDRSILDKNKATEKSTDTTINDQAESENLVDTSIKQAIEDPLKNRLKQELALLSPITIFDKLSFERKVEIVVVENDEPSYWYGNVGGYGHWGPAMDLYGLGAQIDLGHSYKGKIDLGISVGLGSFRYSTSTTQATAIATGGRMIFSNNEAANVLNSSFSSATYLDMGVHTGWNITSAIKLRADAGYSFLFTSIFNNGAMNENTSLDSQDPIGAPELEDLDVEVENEKGGFTAFEYKLDREWFPYTSIGLQVGLSSKWGLDLSYRKVYGTLFESSANPLSMDRIRLGVKYQFLKKY